MGRKIVSTPNFGRSATASFFHVLWFLFIICLYPSLRKGASAHIGQCQCFRYYDQPRFWPAPESGLLESRGFRFRPSGPKYFCYYIVSKAVSRLKGKQSILDFFFQKESVVLRFCNTGSSPDIHFSFKTRGKKLLHWLKLKIFFYLLQQKYLAALSYSINTKYTVSLHSVL